MIPDTKDKVIIRLLEWIDDEHYGLREFVEQEIKKEFGYEVPTNDNKRNR